LKSRSSFRSASPGAPGLRLVLKCASDLALLLEGIDLRSVRRRKRWRRNETPLSKVV
jgi:hypothetical protein